MGTMVKLGPPNIIAVLESFYTQAVHNIDFKNLYSRVVNREEFQYLGFLVKSAYLPPLYILTNINGPIILGIASNFKEAFHKHDVFKMPIPPVLFELYRNIFKSFSEPLPEMQKTDCFYFTMANEVINFPSFTVLGQEKTSKHLMMRESVRGNEKVTVAGFFSEEALGNLLNAFEKWNEKGVRYDFENDLAMISLKVSKEKKNRYNTLELKYIAQLIKQMCVEWFPDFFEKKESFQTFPDINQMLVSFTISFKNLAKFLLNSNIFFSQFNSVLENTARLFLEQLRPNLVFFESQNTNP